MYTLLSSVLTDLLNNVVSVTNHLTNHIHLLQQTSRPSCVRCILEKLHSKHSCTAGKHVLINSHVVTLVYGIVSCSWSFAQFKCHFQYTDALVYRSLYLKYFEAFHYSVIKYSNGKSHVCVTALVLQSICVKRLFYK